METFGDLIMLILFFIGGIAFLFLGPYVIMIGMNMIEDGIDYGEPLSILAGLSWIILYIGIIIVFMSVILS
jgi:hypothetical protein